MAALPTMLRLALALLLGLPVAGVEEARELDAAFAVDDECAADSDPATCALNALQLRASKMSTQVEVAGEATAATWVLGRQDATCTETCSAQRMSCSAADFKSVTGWQTLFTIAQQAGSQCIYSWANDNKHGPGFNNVPAICNLARCGSDLQGTCAYDMAPKATCDGRPATGFSRLCPCAASSGSGYMPAPLPSPYVPAPGPSPYSPAPGPSPITGSGPSTTSGSCQALGMSADTGGSCKYLSCSKSRGKTTCDKKTSKCMCAAGYCADKKGKCVKSS